MTLNYEALPKIGSYYVSFVAKKHFYRPVKFGSGAGHKPEITRQNREFH